MNERESYKCICPACEYVTEIPWRIYWSCYEKYKCPGCQQNIDINQASFLWIAKHQFIPAMIRQSQCADIARLCGASGQDGREIKIDNKTPVPKILRIPVPPYMQVPSSSIENASQVNVSMTIEVYELEKIESTGNHRVAIYRLQK